MTKLKVLLFTKRTSWCDKVVEFCEKNFECEIYRGERGDYNPPMKLDTSKVDYVISYLSPWILPKWILERAKIAAINFHPGPPKYPGIGGYNFALYNGDKEYGVVCHYMEEKVDSGEIISMKTFPIKENDTVESLKEKSMVYLLSLFFEWCDGCINITDGMKWEREPYTRKDLQALCRRGPLSLAVSSDEIDKWYNACYFPNAQDKPYFELNKRKYYIIREDHYEETRGISRQELSSSYWNPTDDSDL